MSTYGRQVGGGSGTAVGWEQERMAIATARIPSLNRIYASDLNDNRYSLNGSTSFSNDASGGIVQLGSAGTTGTIYWGTAGTATNAQKMIKSAKVEPWYAAVRMKVRNTMGASKNICILDLGNLTDDTELQWLQATSGTVCQLIHYPAGVAQTPISCGAVGTLGGGTIAFGAYFTCGVWFDGTQLVVEFNDTSALVQTGSQLNNMATGACYLATLSNDNTAGVFVDSIFLATVGAT